VLLNGKLIYKFRLEDGSILECNHSEIKSVIKKIDKGEIKIIPFEN
jgi:hypothetical protein